MLNCAKLTVGIASAALSLFPCFAQSSTVDIDRVANWPAPLYWQQPTAAVTLQSPNGGTSPERESPRTTGPQLGATSTLVAIAPCRLSDTRGNGFTGAFGPPSLTAQETRVYPVPTGSCSLPANAVAYSFNIAVVPSGSTMRWLTAWPDGMTMPVLATLNDKAGLVTSNAAIVAAGTNGAVDIFVEDASDVIIDVNGYYAPVDSSGNVFMGQHTGSGITTGTFNVGVGDSALVLTTSGTSNVAIGPGALGGVSTGGFNIGIGNNAGFSLTTGYSNIDIDSTGSASDEYTTRIGDNQNATFIGGIRGVTTGSANAIPVVIDSNGQLGTVSSSSKVKRDIADMGDTTETLMSLRPVQFRYIAHGADAPLQYGLIAEEVAEVAPELVAHNAKGEIETVYYDKVNAMLLNQVQTQQRQIEAERAQSQSQIEQLAGLVSQLESRLAELESRVK